MAEVENKQVKSRRDAMVERLKGRYPEKEFVDDEAIYGQIYDDYDNYDNDIEGFKEREASLVDLFNKNPSAARFITDLAKGEDPWIAVIKRLGIDGITDLLNNPEKQEEYAKANADYVEKLGKETALEDEYNANRSESLALLERIQGEKQLSDEQMDAAYALITKIAKEAIMGKFSEETVNMALNALNHDTDVENARAEGAIAGKNAKIDEKLRKADEGDGMPMSGSGNSTKAQRPVGYNIFAEARGAN